jgi:hypothetical protein
MEAAMGAAMEAATEESMEAANRTVAVPMVLFQFLNSFYVWKSAFRVLLKSPIKINFYIVIYFLKLPHF